MDPAKMTELGIYPEIWEDEGDDTDTLEWLQQSFQELQSFVQETAQRGMGLVVFTG